MPHARVGWLFPSWIVAPARVARKLADAIGERHATVACSDREKAVALAATGTYLAVVIVEGFAELAADTPIIRISRFPDRPWVVGTAAAGMALAGSSHVSEYEHHEARPRTALWWILGGFLVVAGFFLWTEHRAHLFGALPYLLLIACLVMHLFHHRGHGGHVAHQRGGPR